MNRILYTILIVLTCSSATLAQKRLDAGINYGAGVPLGDMNNNINLSHSLNAHFNYRAGATAQAWVGLQTGLGLYALKTIPQTYIFGNGDRTNTQARFSSNVFNVHVNSGYELLRNKNVTPYITAKAGLSNYFSRIFVEDPTDIDGCRPLENKSLLNDWTVSYGGGAGVRVDISKWMDEPKGSFWLDFSANYLTGQPVSYLNTKKLQQHDHSSGTADPDAKAVNMRFVNIQTGVEHEHKIAEVYTSKINLLDFRIGINYRFGN